MICPCNNIQGVFLKGTMRQPQRSWRIRFSELFLFWVLTFCLLFTISFASDDYGQEYVDEILRDEERMNQQYAQHENGYYTTDDEAQEAANHAARLEEEKKERARLEREAQIEAQLQKLDNQARKKAKRQKKKDAKLVKKILKYAQAERHYAVLGLINKEIKFGPVVLFGRQFGGPIRLFHVSTKKIRRAYRNRALAVHPDKNLDGRAQEAFVAVEESASLLSDETKRTAYDELVSAARRKLRQDVTGVIMEGVHVVWGAIGKVIGLIKGVLGPFATPIFVLGALMIP